jgi:hypothetical protein
VTYQIYERRIRMGYVAKEIKLLMNKRLFCCIYYHYQYCY